MSRVIVDVMLKPEIADPQGQTITSALSTLGYQSITEVRQGKHFVLEVNEELTPQVLDVVTKAAAQLLANPVMEDYTVRLENE